jgi:transcription elongation factor Elf1
MGRRSDVALVAEVTDLIADSTITCPKCGHRASEQMPTDACRFFYDCNACGERLKPLPETAACSAHMDRYRVHRSRQAGRATSLRMRTYGTARCAFTKATLDQ